MNYLNFNSRETYIALATEWKKEYAELSQKIRDTRKQFNEAQRAYQKVMYSDKSSRAEWKEVERLRDERFNLCNEANSLLWTRFGMKEQAQEQYEALKQVA